MAETKKTAEYLQISLRYLYTYLEYIRKVGRALKSRESSKPCVWIIAPQNCSVMVKSGVRINVDAKSEDGCFESINC